MLSARQVPRYNKTIAKEKGKMLFKSCFGYRVVMITEIRYEIVLKVLLGVSC